MADKSIDQLNAAERIYPTDKFVVQQSGQAKSVSGQVMINHLTEAADGHGGIQSIVKVGTSGLVDTYRITLADTTVIDIPVTNGRSITGVSKTGTSGLVDTHTIKYNDGTTSTFTVTNGAKGDKGDNAYTWIKYASQEPTESSHSMGDIPDEWRGEYNGPLSAPPTDWKQYKWYKIKGDKGNTGDPATLANKSVSYQVGDSGSIIPSGAWVSSIPVVPQGKYLWTKTEIQFNSGDPIVSYVSARQGLDGSGSVASVNNVIPDYTGNVTLTAADVGARPDTWTPTASDVSALPISGGYMTGEIRMNGQPISGLNAPKSDDEAATKGYVDTNKVDKANVVNNFTTTEEGYVADARALKVLNDSKLSMDLLWDNASPISEFAEQTISLDLSGYDFVLCSFKLTSTNGTSKSFISEMQKTCIAEFPDLNSGSAAEYRQYDVNNNGVKFYNAVYVTGSTKTEQARYIVPTKIYGIKGASA